MTTATLSPADLAHALAIEWHDDLPTPRQVKLYAKPLASGHHVVIVAADMDDLFLWSQHIGGVLDVPVSMDQPAYTSGHLGLLPVFVRTEVES